MRLARQRALRGQLLPKDLAVRGSNAQDVALLAVGAGSRQQNVIAPDDRRGVAPAGQIRLPQKIFRLTPSQRHVAAIDIALAARPAPARPRCVLSELRIRTSATKRQAKAYDPGCQQSKRRSRFHYRPSC